MDLAIISDPQRSIIPNTAILHDRSTEGGASQAEIKAVSSSIQEISISEIGNTVRLLQVSPSQVGTLEGSTCQYSRTQVSSLQSGILKASASQIGAVHTNSNQISFVEAGTNQVSAEGSAIQSRIAQICTGQVSTFQVGPTQIGPLKLSGNEQDKFQVSIGQVDILQHSSNQVGISDNNPTEIPFTNSISLQQFLGSHNYTLQNTTVPTWLSYLGGTTPFNLNIEVTDLPTGQLAVVYWR